MKKSHTMGAETLYRIKQRYEDAALVIFHELEHKTKPLGYFTSKDSTKSYSFICQGNTATVVQKTGNNVIKVDEKPVQSQICSIM